MSVLRHRSSGDRFGLSADWLLVAIPGLIWGASFLFIAAGLKAIGPSGVTFVGRESPWWVFCGLPSL